MSILDRTVAPKAGNFRKIPLPNYQTFTLSNGIPVYMLQYGTVEVADIQVVFRTGAGFESKVGVADFTGSNLQEGTQHYTSIQIAEKLDEYGAWINIDAGYEIFGVKVITLTKRIQETIPLLKEIAIHPTFPQEEFTQLKTRTLQSLSVSEQRTRYMAKRNFGHLLFGDHPYGGNLGKEELAHISREDVVAYHAEEMNLANSFMMVVGRFDEKEMLAALEASFGQENLEAVGTRPRSAAEKAVNPQLGRHYFEMPGNQATVRLGHIGFHRKHPDYYKMEVVNTILGGYFGSRLMKNIREEKGYTYGIYSSWAARRHTGFFVIQADVGNEYIEATIEEVKKEIKILQTEEVSAKELEVAKNYMLGKSINNREAFYQLADMIRFSIASGVSFEDIDKKFDVIQSITAKEILTLANTYFRPDDMLEVVCGTMNE